MGATCTKAQLIESLHAHMRKNCAGGADSFRDVFEIAERFFLSWLERHPMDEFIGEENFVIHELSAMARASPIDVTSAWISVFASLYYCDNFPGFAHSAWTWLIRNDPNNLLYAIQAC